MVRYLFALNTPRRTSGSASFTLPSCKWDTSLGTLLFGVLGASADAYKVEIINATPRDTHQIRSYLFTFVLDDLRRCIFTRTEKTIKIMLRDMKIHSFATSDKFLSMRNAISKSTSRTINSRSNILESLAAKIPVLFQSN